MASRNGCIFPKVQHEKLGLKRRWTDMRLVSMLWVEYHDVVRDRLM